MRQQIHERRDAAGRFEIPDRMQQPVATRSTDERLAVAHEFALQVGIRHRIRRLAPGLEHSLFEFRAIRHGDVKKREQLALVGIELPISSVSSCR